MTEITKYEDGKFVLPSAVDYINYEAHAAIDIIQIKGELFKVGEEISYNGQGLTVQKVIKKYPIQTELKIDNRLDILKVRYFCDKIKVPA